MSKAKKYCRIARNEGYDDVPCYRTSEQFNRNVLNNLKPCAYCKTGRDYDPDLECEYFLEHQYQGCDDMEDQYLSRIV